MIDLFCYMAGIATELADVSNFEEGEIRCLNTKNPPTPDNIKNWDGILEPKKPEHADIGINKEREIFWYSSDGKWINIKNKTI